MLRTVESILIFSLLSKNASGEKLLIEAEDQLKVNIIIMTYYSSYDSVSVLVFSKCFPSEAGNEQRHEFLPSNQQDHKYILSLTKFRTLIRSTLRSIQQ